MSTFFDVYFNYEIRKLYYYLIYWVHNKLAIFASIEENNVSKQVEVIMEFSPIIAGAAAGLSANEIQRQLDKRVHGEPDHENMFQALHSAITELRTELKTITGWIADTHLPPIDITIQLQLAPWFWTLQRQDRRYGMIFVPNATTALTFNIPQLGNVNFTPPIGWTELNFPSGTQVFLASGNPTSIIYRCTNIPLGASVI